MGKYYCLISGLPEIQLDDVKQNITLSSFKEELLESLSPKDMKVVNLFFMKFDNENLLALLENQDAEMNDLGMLSRDEILEIIQDFRENETPSNENIYPYFRKFIPAYLDQKPLWEKMTWPDQLSSCYYDFATSAKSTLVSDWFTFNLNITNILTAVNCRKYNLDVDKNIVGSGEVSDAIRSSNAKDFGILPIFPIVDDVLRVSDEADFFERERKIDLMKWQWLEEEAFFHYFDVDRIFSFLLRLEMIERWSKLEKETGLTIFKKMIASLQHSFEFPAEFKVS